MLVRNPDCNDILNKNVQLTKPAKTDDDNNKFIRHSSDNIRSINKPCNLQLISNDINYKDEKIANSLENILESPLIKTPVEKWIESQNRIIENLSTHQNRDSAIDFEKRYRHYS